MFEFFSYESELWYRNNRGEQEKLTENSTEVINFMIDFIEEFYPKAYKALCDEYKKCKFNLPFFKFRIVKRFCKCNFGNIDNIEDIDDHYQSNLECVSCPLRGECKYEGIICRPEFNTKISKAEMRVFRLWFDGSSRTEIADTLCLSINTINNHIRNIETRLDIHSKAELFKYAEKNNLFK